MNRPIMSECRDVFDYADRLNEYIDTLECELSSSQNNIRNILKESIKFGLEMVAAVEDREAQQEKGAAPKGEK